MHLKATALAVMVMVLEISASRSVWDKTTTTPSAYTSPRHQKNKADTNTKVRQGPTKFLDTIMNDLPSIISTIRNVTKGATEKQQLNLQHVSKFIAPALRVFLGLQSGPNGLTYEDRAMLDEVSNLTEYLSSAALTKPISQPSNDKTRDLLPDYTDLLESPDTFLSFTNEDTALDLPSTVTERQKDSLFVGRSHSFDSSLTNTPSSSKRTFGSFDSSPDKIKQIPTLSFPPSVRTSGSFDSFANSEKHAPVSAFSPSTFEPLDESPLNEKLKPKSVFSSLTRTFGSFDSPGHKKQTPISFPPSESFGSSPDINKQVSTSPFSFLAALGAFNSSPDNVKQTPTSTSPPPAKITVSPPVKFRFTSPRVQTSSQVSRPRQATGITDLRRKHFRSSLAEAEESKRKQTTPAPKIQPSEETLNSMTSMRRYTAPSRLLRQQLFGNIQSTSSSSTTDSVVNQYSVRPLTGSRSGRRAVFRRRRLSSTQP